ncbi:carboxymuconolactone decarboxylase family protein [Terriglobus sp. TAA 43]|uniref:carboxymuconolactone decarboxylase family protein n=1 Tax=Terriglobus sp. TAA 43 TaxID=278961 RepID=UPI000645AB36|nr:carboxymuconolactone decarboxylase family protein [Terriglobus sp. TAA 43]
MPHIDLPEGMPGITAGFSFRPETAKPMRELAHVLLHTSGNEGLSSADRELIASFVSSRNDCFFCQTSHSFAAAHLHPEGIDAIDAVCRDYLSAPIPNKLKALLAIAEAVQIDGKRVTKELVEKAKEAGATDTDIHDTVLIAAAFCMYNRYVDGLDTWQPRDTMAYVAMGKRMAEQGYSGEPGPQK